MYGGHIEIPSVIKMNERGEAMNVMSRKAEVGRGRESIRPEHRP